MSKNVNVDIYDPQSLLNNIGLNEGAEITPEDFLDESILAEAAIFNALTANELDALLENSNELDTLKDEGLLSEKVQIIRVSKEGQLKRLEGQALLVIARKKNDKDFKKLVKVWKMRRFLLDRLRKKYGTMAKTEAKKMHKAMGRSKSIVAKKVAQIIK